jgi:hypothetical protein
MIAGLRKRRRRRRNRDIVDYFDDEEEDVQLVGHLKSQGNGCLRMMWKGRRRIEDGAAGDDDDRQKMEGLWLADNVKMVDEDDGHK